MAERESRVSWTQGDNWGGHEKGWGTSTCSLHIAVVLGAEACVVWFPFRMFSAL